MATVAGGPEGGLLVQQAVARQDARRNHPPHGVGLHHRQRQPCHAGTVIRALDLLRREGRTRTGLSSVLPSLARVALASSTISCQ